MNNTLISSKYVSFDASHFSSFSHLTQEHMQVFRLLKKCALKCQINLKSFILHFPFQCEIYPIKNYIFLAFSSFLLCACQFLRISHRTWIYNTKKVFENYAQMADCCVPYKTWINWENEWARDDHNKSSPSFFHFLYSNLLNPIFHLLYSRFSLAAALSSFSCRLFCIYVKLHQIRITRKC